MRGAATKAMSDIVEERQRSRCPPAAAPLRAAARRLAGFVARSSHTAPGIARRSRLASGPGGLQQNVKLFLREPLGGSMRCALRWFILLAAVSALLVGPALGQAVFGGILGTVTDPSGAAVPNADITITDTDRGSTYQTKSNADGNYSQTHLLAVHYKVKVIAAR